MAIADAVREVASQEITQEVLAETPGAQPQLGRRGHLRAVPSQG
jgi:hypothetical protein